MSYFIDRINLICNIDNVIPEARELKQGQG